MKKMNCCMYCINWHQTYFYYINFRALCEKFSDRKEPLKVREVFCLNDELKNKALFKQSSSDDNLIIKQILGITDANTKLFFDCKLPKRSVISRKIDNLGKFLIKKHDLESARAYCLLPYRPVSYKCSVSFHLTRQGHALYCVERMLQFVICVSCCW